ncbi:NADH:flavin oxidoreductase/NADH oxidase [Halalkalicoccus tibetensis]|uniref:NADH:flavin oxidoreductase/NADH oxidase n=1 Tax=Halalkalicoccus tibetensis TaxID=175632 RepID=A0ABD5V6V9_9EURY
MTETEDEDPDLLSPLAIRGTELPNRVMVSPMCQYSCEERDGIATEWHRTHLNSRAVGGAGVVMTEAMAVSPEGRITPEDLGIWSDEHAEALAPITGFVREQGSVPAIQLAHAGRKASKSRPWEGSEPVHPEDGGWEVVAPSETSWPYDGKAPEQRAMSQSDIEGFVEDFRRAAERALEIGFEVAEVHAAHGYLLHEFLSPATNDRDDEYGGDFENRTRLTREVTQTVREVWPDEKPVFVRISGTDWLPDQDSWTIEESIELADELHELGADLIDVSSGGLDPTQQLPEEGSVGQLPLAERIREETDSDIAVGAVGGITEAEQADSLIREGRADLAIIGRKHLRDPYFTLHAARELDAADRVETPPQYQRGF